LGEWDDGQPIAKLEGQCAKPAVGGDRQDKCEEVVVPLYLYYRNLGPVKCNAKPLSQDLHAVKTTWRAYGTCAPYQLNAIKCCIPQVAPMYSVAASKPKPNAGQIKAKAKAAAKQAAQAAELALQTNLLLGVESETNVQVIAFDRNAAPNLQLGPVYYGQVMAESAARSVLGFAAFSATLDSIKNNPRVGFAH